MNTLYFILALCPMDYLIAAIDRPQSVPPNRAAPTLADPLRVAARRLFGTDATVAKKDCKPDCKNRLVSKA
jgi:hypothetical protein